jgi:hypothetical protein
MNDTVLTVLIVAVAVIVVLFMFRRQLSRFFLRADKKGLEARLETHNPGAIAKRSDSITIKGNQQVGADNAIAIERSNVNMADNLQLGERQRITVRPDSSTSDQKP